MRFAGYEHLLGVSERQRWEPGDIDLSADARNWPGLADELRQRLTKLLAGFVAGEAELAGSLQAAEAADPLIAACMAAQASEEERHGRFFDRVATAVLDLSGATPAERREAARRLLPDDFGALFGPRLSNAAGAGESELFSLVHLLLEGVVFSAGEQELEELLGEPPLDTALPGIREGIDRVARDERWHLGFGLQRLRDLRPPADALAALGTDGASALDAWGDAISPATRERVDAMHRRRLAMAFSAR